MIRVSKSEQDRRIAMSEQRIVITEAIYKLKYVEDMIQVLAEVQQSIARSMWDAANKDQGGDDE